MRQPTNAALLNHSTPKGAPPETGRKGGQSPQTETVMGAEGAAPAGVMYLLTVVVITSIMICENPEVGHDQHSKEQGARPRKPRLARFAFYFLVRGLLRS